MIHYIKNAKPEEMEEILQAVLTRYRELHPDWEIMLLSLDKRENKNDQLDRIITLLNNMRH